MVFDPSSNCIVTAYYSGSVNIGSTNSQSLQPNMAPPLLIEQGGSLLNRDKRLFQKLDNVIESLSRLYEVIAIYELLTPKIIPKVATEIVTLSASQLRTPKPKITGQTITVSEGLAKIAKHFTSLTGTETISDLLAGLRGAALSGTITISESLKRPLIGRAQSGTITVSQAFKKLPKRLFTETITIVENTVVRGFVQNIGSEIIAISDSLLLTAIPYIAESITISQLFTAVKARLFVFSTDTITIGDAVSRRLKSVRTMIEGRCSILFNGLGPE